MAQQLANSCHAVCSPVLVAMEIVNLGKTTSEPFADCGHVLSDSTDLSSTSSTASFPGNSPPESADTYLYILLMRAYLAASMAVTVCDHACQQIISLAADSGSLSGDTALLIDLPEIQPSTHSELPLAAVGLLSSIVCVAHAAVRLSWIAVMGLLAGGCIHDERAGTYTFLEQAAEGVYICHAISSVVDSCTVQGKKLAVPTS